MYAIHICESIMSLFNSKSLTDRFINSRSNLLKQVLSHYYQADAYQPIRNSKPPYHIEPKYNWFQRLIAKILRLNTSI